MLSVLIFILLIIPALANAAADPIRRLRNVGGKAGYTGIGVQDLAGRLINAFLGLLGSVFIVLLVYGGYKWMMASGEEEEITKAKGIIRQAIIGLIVVMSAGAIAQFVVRGLERATTN